MSQFVLTGIRGEPIRLVSGVLILVGRGESCEIRLDDPSASRVHCRLLARDGKVFLTDAGSRWGTFVNSVRVTECELVPGDEITIGETTLRLVADRESHGTTLARRSQIDRPPGLTIAPPAKFPWLPEVDRAITASTPSKGDGAASPGGCPSALQSLTASEYVGSCFAAIDIEALVCRTRTGLLFRGVRGGQTVALKLLHPPLLPEETARARFLRAVETTQGLKHPHLVELIDGGLTDGVLFAVSEYIEGESAAEMIRRIGVAGMLDWRTTLRIALHLASALEYLEARGVLHRNVTPQHILVGAQDGHARLNDLLLAKTLDDAQPVVTCAGEVLGEIAFVSPEQLGSGQPVDHRSDIYQLGATLYALLTGRPPFEGPHAAAVIGEILRTPPVPPTRSHLSIPALLEGTILTMLAKRPQDRFPSATALLNALERVQKYAS